MDSLVIFGLFVFGRKWIFFFYFSSSFQKMSFALGRKCYVRNWTATMFCDIGTGDFSYRPKMVFHFRRHFRLRLQMKNASSFGLYIKLYQITPYVNDFQQSAIPFSNSLKVAWKISFTLHLLLRDVVSAVYATATWLGGWMGGCLSQPVLCLND